jgi:hypothetical protein
MSVEEGMESEEINMGGQNSNTESLAESTQISSGAGECVGSMRKFYKSCRYCENQLIYEK